MSGQALSYGPPEAVFEGKVFFSFERLLGKVEAFNRRPLRDEDWMPLDGFSEGDRLWYRVGAHMARTIVAVHGRAEGRA